MNNWQKWINRLLPITILDLPFLQLFFLLGLPVKPLIYVKRVHVPLEEQFKYLSDESSDSSDEEWTLGPKKKKKDNKNEPKSAGKMSFRCVFERQKRW